MTKSKSSTSSIVVPSIFVIHLVNDAQFLKTTCVAPPLSTTYLKVLFKESIPVSNICFLHFLANDKNLSPLIDFIVPGSIEYRRIAKLEERVISIYS